MHCHWRDCQAWNQEGLPLSTTSNEACKLYDAVLTQYVGWYDEDGVGGIETAAKKLTETDPDFVMGRVLTNGLDLIGTGRTINLDPDFKAAINTMTDMAAKQDITERERQHAKAIQMWAEGDTTGACHVWEDILVAHPTDMLALKFAHDSYFYLGYQPHMRDSIARVLPYWKPTMPLYGYLFGMHSFGLVETSLFSEAEKVSRKGLDINPKDAWSTHSLAHVLEMMGRQDEGISFLSTTVRDWTTCGMLACHNFWHWAVYHIEKGEHTGAVDIFDSEVGERCKKSGAMLDIVDACSLLYRLELEGVNVGDRWNDVFETCRPHTDDHILAFNDVHILMSCLGAKKKDVAKEMMESIREFVKNGKGTNRDVTAEVGLPLCEAFEAYDSGDFARAVNLLNPLRYKVLSIGGSNAQRDVFNLFLINAALKSEDKMHHKLARCLLAERKCLKENAPMTDRLTERAMALHAD
ncbi:tetratricopeptide repeat protein 38 isoform X2 [Lingula anatina]|uniref:Tetratricopeptide repeat protein 38 n=1 Tax=Lingula anatina TaxID=7574 RepID=A0A1S3HI47_LINAN|nr:tetratricopeptide repeat protein 38 isoform X2 [Lingula anatina]|eukprot:XP_013384664.1 tetratricopeptide repeat protein 38 isoform X2 [Lingula anatina]